MTPVQYVKGVGPKLAAVFRSRGIETVKDLIQFFPRDYEDRSKLSKIADLRPGQRQSVALIIHEVRKIPLRRQRRSLLQARCGDETGQLMLKWFHSSPHMVDQLQPGKKLIVTGEVKSYLGLPEIYHPEINWKNDEYNVGRIVPIYTEIDGIPTRSLRKILWNAMEGYIRYVQEDLPARFIGKYAFPTKRDAIRELHYPTDQQPEKTLRFQSIAAQRLIYEEFFKFEYLVLSQKLRMRSERGHSLNRTRLDKDLAQLKAQLPFLLTAGQSAALSEILRDMSQPFPMNRLIQGDVGSGKTAVALISAFSTLSQGFQSVLMAPTEILAEQHFKSASRFSDETPFRPTLLTGKTSQEERKKILESLERGEPIFLIGTHALLEEWVKFKKLALVIVDEQHRFGVEQRRTLRQKGMEIHPHMLIMTATPIPRTLALTAYGDLSVSNIRELPPGRSPIITRVVLPHQKNQAYSKIYEEIKSGRQAYFIYPLVKESEAEGFTSLKAAISEAEKLANDVFPNFRVGILHGQMRPDEKTEVMNKFQANEIQILVSTTVVEVGVDIPNSTIIVVEHAERFGLSQLHQLRGRVGRGTHQSYCFLFTSGHQTETATHRLKIMEQTSDGFKVAEADLEIRGPGEFLGTRQSGGLPFKLANLIRDQEWLIRAREDAIELLKDDPTLKNGENQALKDFFELEGSVQFERLKTS